MVSNHQSPSPQNSQISPITGLVFPQLPSQTDQKISSEAKLEQHPLENVAVFHSSDDRPTQPPIEAENSFKGGLVTCKKPVLLSSNGSSAPINSVLSSAVASAVSKGCSTAAICITEAQRRASDLLSSAAGFLARPLVAAIASGRRTPLDITALIEGGIPEVVVLGQPYRVDREEGKTAFLEDYYSRICFTYRRHFAPVDTSPLSCQTTSYHEVIQQLSADSLCNHDVADGEEEVPHLVTSDTFSSETAGNHQERPSLLTTAADLPETQSKGWTSPKNDSTSEQAPSGQSCSATTSSPNNSYDRSNSLMTSQTTSIPFFQRVLSRNKAGQIISDAGWGCMIRATQMALAQTLSSLRLGRDWRRRRKRRGVDTKETNDIDSMVLSIVPRASEFSNLRISEASSRVPIEEASPMEDPPTAPSQSISPLFYSTPAFTELISLFMDHPSRPLSIHSIARLCALHYGIPVGQWLGPTSCAQAAASLMTSPKHKSQFPDITAVVFPDGLLVHTAVKKLFQHPSPVQPGGRDPKPPAAVLIILCMRLGTERFNTERYRTPLARCFRLNQFQGLAGGGSLTSAHFFFGICARGLLYLDPHAAILPAFLPDLHRTHSSTVEMERPNTKPFSLGERNQAGSASLPDHGRHSISDPFNIPETPPANTDGSLMISKSVDDSYQLNPDSPLDVSATSLNELIDPTMTIGSSDHNGKNKDDGSSLDDGYKFDQGSSSSNTSSSSSPLCSISALIDSDVSTEEYENFVLSHELQFFPIVERSSHVGPSVLPWTCINPSMALYFLCRTLGEYDDLVQHLEAISVDVPELFEMVDTPLDLSRTAEMDLEEFAMDDNQN